MILRIIGLLCLGGVGIAGVSWWNIDKIMTPVSEEAVLSIGRISSLVFTSTQEVSARNYSVQLYFENSRALLITCEDIKSLGIQWAISNSNIEKSWHLLASTDYSCDVRDNTTVVSFLAPSFKPSTKYYFHLSNNNKSERQTNLKVRAAIQHEDGIGTHYLFMNKALLELLGGGLFFVSLICFLIDFWKVFHSWRLSNQSKQGTLAPPNR